MSGPPAELLEKLASDCHTRALGTAGEGAGQGRVKLVLYDASQCLRIGGIGVWQRTSVSMSVAMLASNGVLMGRSIPSTVT